MGKSLGGTVGAKNRDIMINTTKDSRFNLDWNQGHELRQAKSKSGESARTRDGMEPSLHASPAELTSGAPAYMWTGAQPTIMEIRRTRLHAREPSKGPGKVGGRDLTPIA